MLVYLEWFVSAETSHFYGSKNLNKTMRLTYQDWLQTGRKVIWLKFHDMGVSKNRGTPKWMVYNGKPY